MKELLIQNCIRKFFLAIAILANIVVCYNSAYTQIANYIWAKHAGWTDYEKGFSITTDRSGNPIITGIYNRTTRFGSIVLPDGGSGWDIFLAKYDKYGTLLWALRTGAMQGPTEAAHYIDTDTLDNIILSGFFWNTAIFDEGGSSQTTLTSYGLMTFSLPNTMRQAI